MLATLSIRLYIGFAPSLTRALSLHPRSRDRVDDALWTQSAHHEKKKKIEPLRQILFLKYRFLAWIRGAEE